MFGLALHATSLQKQAPVVTAYAEYGELDVFVLCLRAMMLVLVLSDSVHALWYLVNANRLIHRLPF